MGCVGGGWLAPPHARGMQLILQEFTPKAQLLPVLHLNNALQLQAWVCKENTSVYWHGRRKHRNVCNIKEPISTKYRLPCVLQIDSAVHIFNLNYGYITDISILIWCIKHGIWSLIKGKAMFHCMFQKRGETASMCERKGDTTSHSSKSISALRGKGGAWWLRVGSMQTRVCNMAEHIPKGSG